MASPCVRVGSTFDMREVLVFLMSLSMILSSFMMKYWKNSSTSSPSPLSIIPS